MNSSPPLPLYFYSPAYFSDCRPWLLTVILVENLNPEEPRTLWWGLAQFFFTCGPRCLCSLSIFPGPQPAHQPGEHIYPRSGLTGIAASPPARLSHPATLRSIYIVKFYLFFISLMHYILYILTLSISNSNTFCFVFRKIYKKNTSLLAIGDIISEYFIYFCISRVISWSWPLTHQAVSCLHWI